jgi:hypothetical protein
VYHNYNPSTGTEGELRVQGPPGYNYDTMSKRRRKKRRKARVAI